MVGGLFLYGCDHHIAAPATPPPPQQAADCAGGCGMRVLILGGTKFVGRTIAEHALAAGHTVTITNRGSTPPLAADLFPDAEFIPGDRLGDLRELADRTWDVAIDVNGYLPLAVKKSAQALAGSVGLYCYISTISVYDTDDPPMNGKPSTAEQRAALFAAGGVDESGALLPFDGTADPMTLTQQQSTAPGKPAFDPLYGHNAYGSLKALCEAAAAATLKPEQLLVLRLGVVAGANDHSGRLSYWPMRVRDGGEALWPPADAPLQFIDAADVARWCVSLCEKKTAGVYNTVGTQASGTLGDRPTFGDLAAASVALVKAAGGTPAKIVHASESFLEESLKQYTELPLWQPANSSLHSMSNAKAVAAGLTFRATIDTLRDALETGAPLPVGGAYGIEKVKEQNLLQMILQARTHQANKL